MTVTTRTEPQGRLLWRLEWSWQDAYNYADAMARETGLTKWRVYRYRNMWRAETTALPRAN